jgi:hypothetical protein
MTVQTLSVNPPALPPAAPLVGQSTHTADHATITQLLNWLTQQVQAIEGTGAAVMLAGGNACNVPGTTTGFATITVQPGNQADVLDIYYGTQKIFSLNSYGELRLTAAALNHVAQVIYALSGQSADTWQVLSSSLAVLARVGPDGSASFAGPVSRQLPSGPAQWVNPVLQSGWTTIANRTLALKLTNDNMVQITGHLQPGQISNGTPVATLPPGYAPQYRPESIAVAQYNLIPASSYQGPYIEAQPSGALNIYSIGPSVMPGGRIVICGRYPLDAH